MMHKKFWVSEVEKSLVPKGWKTTPQKHIEQKIRMTQILLKVAFENETKRFLAEFQKPVWCDAAKNKEFIFSVLNEHLETLYAECLPNYIHLCVLNCFSGLSPSGKEIVQKNTTRTDTSGAERLASDLSNALEDFYGQKAAAAKKAAELIEEVTGTTKELLNDLADALESGWKKLDDLAYQQEISGKLFGIYLSGRAKYRYVCENSEASCSACIALDGLEFDLSEAQAGVNLPPMHHHCRCTIMETPALPRLPELPEKLDRAGLAVLRDTVERNLRQVAAGIDGLAEGIGAVWNYFFRESLEDCYGTYGTVEIDGVEYRVNKNSFSSVAIAPDGSFIVPENVSDMDKKLLELMKERDALPEGDPRRAELQDELKVLHESIPEEERKVSYKLPYSYYLFGGDVTERLNEYMKTASADYTYMHERYWAENLIEFKNLVGNGYEMDLKTKPEWQNSAYLYDGELVSQDALGNINYGYFGSFCNFPQSVLMLGAGYAQWDKGNWEWSFLFTALDDPRDTWRIFQGMELYETLN